MRRHVRLLGWLQIIMGLIDILAGIAAFGLLSGMGVLSGDIATFGLMSTMGTLAGTFMLLMALPNLICGVGLLRGWGGWVIVLAVVLAIFNLFKVPWGTAVAIYTFWIAYRLYETSEA
ncbi:MAG TPA: hypothetical protein VK929_04555 [Longimicrobiales bacterium]|nr:hypothetical protein [Longimicrobiales bacterium]